MECGHCPVMWEIGYQAWKKALGNGFSWLSLTLPTQGRLKRRMVSWPSGKLRNSFSRLKITPFSVAALQSSDISDCRLLTPRWYWRKLAYSLKCLPVPFGELIWPKILRPEHGGPNQAVPLLWHQLREKDCWGSCGWQWHCLENLYSCIAPCQAETGAWLTADETDTATASQGTVYPGKWKAGDKVWHHSKKCHERRMLLCSRGCCSKYYQQLQRKGNEIQ